MIKRPLEGIRVIGLEQYMAGPYCTMLLADAGAEVIKIEDPTNPDIARMWGRGDTEELTADPKLRNAPGGGGSAFTQLNRGKKSVTLNPTKPEGNKILHELIKHI